MHEERMAILRSPKVFKRKGLFNRPVITLMLVTMLLVFCFLVVVMSTRSHGLDWENKVLDNRPIIGIVAIDTHSKYGATYISSTYVKYLEQAGARVVPISVEELFAGSREYTIEVGDWSSWNMHLRNQVSSISRYAGPPQKEESIDFALSGGTKDIDLWGGQPEDYYLQMVNFTNGILFPGGVASMNTSLTGHSISYVFRAAMKLNEAGDHYPLWGTCLGFQMMCYRVQGSNLLKPTDAANVSWPLDLMPDYEQSRLFRSAPKNIIEYLKTEPVTQNEHNYGIWKEVFQDSKLSQFFNVLSTNKDRKGQTFISTVEAKNYPFYGVQWHPEKNNFNWNPHYVINHDAHAVDVSQYMANFFVDEARKNGHHFPTVKMEAENLIQNHKLVYFDDGTFTALYYIPA